jgi:hypothetical protein
MLGMLKRIKNKGDKFKSHKYVGDPINTIKIFNDKEVDELVIFDIEASRFNRPINFELLENIASEAFMPIAYGGGIKTLDDAQKLFSLGIEKVVLNTSAIENFDLIKKLVESYGSQSVVFCLDIKKSFFGKYEAYSYSGSKKVKMLPAELAKKVRDTFPVPVIGIGAGVECDGQVLVMHDMLGVYTRKPAKFVKDFLTDEHNETKDITGAFKAYHQAVKDRTFPTPAHSF